MRALFVAALVVLGSAAFLFAVELTCTRWEVAHYRYNVVDFGADPTGMVDSTQAFNLAVIEACRHRGGTVTVPAGNYRVVPNQTWDMTQHGVTLHCDRFVKR